MLTYMTPDTQIPPYMMYPRFLMGTEISETARLLYTVLLDRARISQMNRGWTDADGNVYICFPIKALAEVMHKGETTIKNTLAELEKQHLIQRRRQGIGLPSRIYVLLPADTNAVPMDIGAPCVPDPENKNLTFSCPDHDPAGIQNTNPLTGRNPIQTIRRPFFDGRPVTMRSSLSVTTPAARRKRYNPLTPRKTL